MKLLEQYIYAIGQYLPLKSRNEIKEDLRSQLLDEIDEKYGRDVSEDQIKELIEGFGTPREIAKRYTGERYVINSGLSDLYFMIAKIIVGAMGIAFFTIFVVSLFTENHQGMEIFKTFLQFPLNVIQASISGIGVLTLVFILISKLMKDAEVNLDDDWSTKELESIDLTPEQESKVEAIIAVILIPVCIVLIVSYPQIVQDLENLYLRSGLSLGNRVNMEVFKFYIPIFVIQGVLQVIYHIILLRKEVKTEGLYIFDGIISIVDVVISGVILAGGSLFIYTAGNTGLFSFSTIGIKLLIIIGLVTGIGELIGKVVKYSKYKLSKKY